MLGAELAEVWVLENVVLVRVHVSEELHDDVAAEAQLHSVDNIGEVAERYVAQGSEVELFECCRDLAVQFNHLLGKLLEVFSELVLLHVVHCGRVNGSKLPTALPGPACGSHLLIGSHNVAELNLLESVRQR